MINEISMKNVKGQTAIQKLTGKDIIVGRNGAGKTTRMQSIGLAMLGYVPGKGKTTADVFKLASDDEMSVGLETETFGFERTYTKTRKVGKDGMPEVKISQKLTVSPSMGESTNTQKENRIRQELGDFPCMLDFGAFISMTDNQQRDFIYNLSGNALAWNRERVQKELNYALLRPELQENNQELYDCIVSSIEETMNQFREGIDVQSGIMAMSEFAKDKLKYWKKEKANADGASKKLTELKNKGMETDRDLNANLEKMKELHAQREQIIKDLAELGAKNKALEAKEQELQKVKEEIEKLCAAEDTGTMRGQLEAEIAELNMAISEQNENHNFEEKEKELQNKLASLQVAQKDINENLLKDRTELANAKAEINAHGIMLKKIASQQGRCALSPNIPCNQDFSEFIAETNNLIDDAYDKVDQLEDHIKLLERMAEDVQQDIQKAQEEQRTIDANRREQAKSVTEKMNLLQKKNTELSELNSRAPMLAAKQQQEAEITAYLAENQKIDLTAMEDHKAIVQSQIESLQIKIDEQKRVRNDLINIKANIIDSQTAEFNVIAWTQIGNAIGQKGIKGKIVKEMLNPIMEDVSEKLHEIGIDEEFFFETNSDTGKEIFEFGWGSKPFTALSTGEQLMLMTAMMTCIIERANPPVKVLALDNINDLDAANLGRVIKGLDIIGKNMDNIILAGVAEPTEEDTEGWAIWRL